MSNIRYDSNGEMRCYWCGFRHFTHKRTFASKATLGVGALLTGKKAKCQRCNQYNNLGKREAVARPAIGQIPRRVRSRTPQRNSPADPRTRIMARETGCQVTAQGCRQVGIE